MEELKLKMYQLENRSSTHPLELEDLHKEADDILLQALGLIGLWTWSDFDSNHDCIVDIVAAYKRACSRFWYV